MNKFFTKIAAACIGLAMAIGVGVAVGSGNEAKVAEATTTVKASFTRSGSKDTYSGGTFSRSNMGGSAGATYYVQNGSVGATSYCQILSDTAYWTTAPSVAIHYLSKPYQMFDTSLDFIRKMCIFYSWQPVTIKSHCH